MQPVSNVVPLRLDGIGEASADALVKSRAIEPLLRLAKTAPPGGARCAMRALGRLSAAEALPLLRERAGDADWGMRLSALQALKESKAEGAAKAFEEGKAAEKDARVLKALEDAEIERLVAWLAALPSLPLRNRPREARQVG